MKRNFQIVIVACSLENWGMTRKEPQRVYQTEDLAKDLDGLKVWEWDGAEAETLLQTFFPVESNRAIDFTLED